jgi:hypothetical protein
VGGPRWVLQGKRESQDIISVKRIRAEMPIGVGPGPADFREYSFHDVHVQI